MATGLPYSTIEKEPFRSFIEKEVGYKLPSESSIQKTYTDVVVGKREREMMEVLTVKDLYVAFDEAMDKHNEPVGAVLVENLESTDRPYAIYVGRMSSVNGDTVANAFRQNNLNCF